MPFWGVVSYLASPLLFRVMGLRIVGRFRKHVIFSALAVIA
jgi:hypothetical protein